MSKLANKWRVRLNTNELKKLLKKYPDKPWDWGGISDNCGLELDMLTPACDNNHKTVFMDYVYFNTRQPADLVDPNYILLSMNKNITWQFVLKNIEEAWDWDALSQNSAITFEIIRDNPYVGDKRIPWNWAYASENPNITPEIIRANRVLDGVVIPWDYAHLSRNTSTTWEFVMSTLCPNCQVFHDGWDWDCLSAYVATSEIVNAYFNAPWNYNSLSTNPKVDLATLARCFAAVPDEKKLPADHNPNAYSFSQTMAWGVVSSSKVMSVDDVAKYRLPWNWGGLSSNCRITLQDMLDHPEYPWDWNYAATNINVDLDAIKNPPVVDGGHIEWDWEWFSLNPCLTADSIEANIDEDWDWSALSGNLFNNHVDVRERLERLAAEEDVRIPLFFAECCVVLPPVLAHLVMEYDAGVWTPESEHMPSRDYAVVRLGF